MISVVQQVLCALYEDPSYLFSLLSKLLNAHAIAGESISTGKPIVIGLDGLAHIAVDAEIDLGCILGISVNSAIVGTDVEIALPGRQVRVISGLPIGRELWICNGQLMLYSDVPVGCWTRSAGMLIKDCLLALYLGHVIQKGT